MIPLHVNKIKNVQNALKIDIDRQRINAFQKLQTLRNGNNNPNEIAYLDRVIQLFSDPSFLLKTPNEIDIIIANMLPLPQLRYANNGNALPIQLTDEIQLALGYIKLRSKFYPKYFREVGLKACVYCNSQLTIVIKKNRTKIDARFEVDHYHSKRKYPYLSISLFNLYPCCSSCNKRKSTLPINFNLYTDEKAKSKKSEYKFVITRTSKCTYLLTKDTNDIEIKFIDNTLLPNGYKSLQGAFNIKEIHDTQKDIIAELIIKSQIYNENFKQILQNNFSKLSLSQSDFERVIVGNYTEEKDIHKRPFSKMTMDIAKQLGLTNQKP